MLMSKYDQLWKYVAKENKQLTVLSFEEIKVIIGIEIDHSFLNYKKELIQYGFSVDKISLKNKTVAFIKMT
jgi:hypothetical protein